MTSIQFIGKIFEVVTPFITAVLTKQKPRVFPFLGSLLSLIDEYLLSKIDRVEKELKEKYNIKD